LHGFYRFRGIGSLAGRVKKRTLGDQSLEVIEYFFPLPPKFQSFAKIAIFWMVIQKPERSQKD
jgi:hypothetical protein